MIGPGDVLGGRYAIVRQLGQGAMGSVFEARHTATERRLAVKVIHRRLAADETLVRRFQAEARAAGRIESEHVAQVVDVDTDTATGVPYLVMEYLVGEDVDALLRRLGPLPPALAARIAAQACLGLERAHAAGIVHRDVKPANLFLAEKDTGERVVKVVDFGIAKLGGDEAPGSTLTRTGGLVGSPLYMSPEQARGVRDLDARTDVWSLGVVLFQMLTGEAPHAGVDLVGDLLIAICTRPPPPVTERAPWVDPALSRALGKALAIERGLRHESARAFRDALSTSLPDGTAIRAADVRGLRSDERGGGEAAAGAFAKTMAASDAQATSDYLAERGLSVDQDTLREHAESAPGGAGTREGGASSDTGRAPPADPPAGAAVSGLSGGEAPPRVEADAGPGTTTAASAGADASARARASRARAMGAVAIVAALLASGAAALLTARSREGTSGVVAAASVAADRAEAPATAGTTGAESAAGPTSAGTPGSSGVPAASVGTGGPEPPLYLPCEDPRRAVGAGPRCQEPARAWCDPADRVVACCGAGLVPTGQDGLCACAPGGTRDRDALRSGCSNEAPAGTSPDELQRVIRRSFPRFRECYEAVLRRSPEARGNVSVTFEIGPDGRVGRTSIQQTSLPDVGAQKCMLSAFRDMRFAPPGDGHHRVTYPVVFEPGD